jgi:hypothetical protein
VIKVDMLDGAFLVLPAAPPSAGHSDKGLVGVVVVHHRPIAGFCPAETKIEAFIDLDRSEPRSIVADG